MVGYSCQEHYQIDIHQLATTIPSSATIIPLSKMVLPAQHDVTQVVVGQEAEISAAQLAARVGDGQTRETPIHVAKDAIADRLEGANQSMGDVVGSIGTENVADSVPKRTRGGGEEVEGRSADTTGEAREEERGEGEVVGPIGTEDTADSGPKSPRGGGEEEERGESRVGNGDVEMGQGEEGAQDVGEATGDGDVEMEDGGESGAKDKDVASEGQEEEGVPKTRKLDHLARLKKLVEIKRKKREEQSRKEEEEQTRRMEEEEARVKKKQEAEAKQSEAERKKKEEEERMKKGKKTDEEQDEQDDETEVDEEVGRMEEEEARRKKKEYLTLSRRRTSTWTYGLKEDWCRTGAGLHKEGLGSVRYMYIYEYCCNIIYILFTKSN